MDGTHHIMDYAHNAVYCPFFFGVYLHPLKNCYVHISLEIVQTISNLRKGQRTDWSGPIHWKNRNRLELPALVTARGRIENGSVMAAPMTQHVRASFQQIQPSCEL